MSSQHTRDRALDADWLAISRRAEGAVRRALLSYPLTADRALETGRGEGGDMALVIDRVAEDAILAELESLGLDLVVVSEERGHVVLGDGGPVHVVVDPIDGSRNAKRALAPFSVSIAVAAGDRVGDVVFAYVKDCVGGEEWWAHAGEGAFRDGEPLAGLDGDGTLELVGLECMRPNLLAESTPWLLATGAMRLRAIGSIALSLCYVAGGRLDAMISLGPCRSVDFAAGQLIVREAGGAIGFPDADGEPLDASLELAWRSRMVAAAGMTELERVLAAAPR
jgi:myo-inositol-1(or 4)-monophosphatase